MIEVSLVPQEFVLGIWPRVEHHLAKAVPYSAGRYQIDDIRHDCVAGVQQLWIVFEGHENIIGAFTTRVSIYPSKKTLNLQFCGGIRLREWAGPVNEVLGRFARDQGCASLEMTGRVGWARVLSPLNWKTVFRVYERQLDG